MYLYSVSQVPIPLLSFPPFSSLFFSLFLFIIIINCSICEDPTIIIRTSEYLNRGNLMQRIGYMNNGRGWQAHRSASAERYHSSYQRNRKEVVLLHARDWNRTAESGTIGLRVRVAIWCWSHKSTLLLPKMLPEVEKKWNTLASPTSAFQCLNSTRSQLTESYEIEPADLFPWNKEQTNRRVRNES